MRSIDLALYADALAARSATLAAQLERARDRLRQAAIERRASRALDADAVARLERLGLLAAVDLLRALPRSSASKRGSRPSSPPRVTTISGSPKGVGAMRR